MERGAGGRGRVNEYVCGFTKAVKEQKGGWIERGRKERGLLRQGRSRED